MAKSIIEINNYIVIDEGNASGLLVFPKTSIYTEGASSFVISTRKRTKIFEIQFSNSQDWYTDESHTVLFTEETLRTFLRQNTKGSKRRSNILDTLASRYNTRVLSLGGIVESEECIEEITDASFYFKPSGYSDGKLHAQLPEDGSGDLDFERAGEATRVNAQGNNENVSVLGSELVINGGFDTDISGWVDYASTSTFDNGTIKVTRTSSNLYIRQNSILQPDKNYLISFDAKASNTLKNLTIYNGSFVDTNLSFNSENEWQSFEYSFLTHSNGDRLILGQQSVSSGDTINFDNISIKEVIEYGIARLDYTDGGCPSLLLEPQSTNLVTDSELNNTEDITTTSTPYTVSFYGTGSMNISGTHTATLIGTGVNERVSLTFTPSSGTLTLTDSGDVDKKQVENLSSATSYIPTSGGTATRLEETATLDNTSLGLTTITETFEDGSTNVITPVPSTYTVSMGRIKKIIGN